jgi:hypothetical protein
MYRQIPERDWKEWRKLSPIALERFCHRILQKCATFSQGAGSTHERYLKLFRYLQSQDADMAAVFNDQRRSNAYQQIASAVSRRIMSRDELMVFSEETQAVIDLFLE